jgi:predicted transcriptional regulator
MTTDTSTLSLTADIVAAYLDSNKLNQDQIPALIQAVHAALTGAEAPEEGPAATQAPTRAQIRRSITDGALISFEDAKPYKMLKRHLSTLGLTPAQYREKWGLPVDYPMTAPGYSAARSALAKSSGLGVKSRVQKAPARGRRKAT